MCVYLFSHYISIPLLLVFFGFFYSFLDIFSGASWKNYILHKEKKNFKCEINCVGTFNAPCKTELRLEMFMCCEYIEKNVIALPYLLSHFSPFLMQKKKFRFQENEIQS